MWVLYETVLAVLLAISTVNVQGKDLSGGGKTYLCVIMHEFSPYGGGLNGEWDYGPGWDLDIHWWELSKQFFGRTVYMYKHPSRHAIVIGYYQGQTSGILAWCGGDNVWDCERHRWYYWSGKWKLFSPAYFDGPHWTHTGNCDEYDPYSDALIVDTHHEEPPPGTDMPPLLPQPNGSEWQFKIVVTQSTAFIGIAALALSCILMVVLAFKCYGNTAQKVVYGME